MRPVLLACASLLAACHSYRRLPAESAVALGESVRIEFPAGQMITLRVPNGETQFHTIRVVEGRLERIAGDTLVVSPRRLDATGRLNIVRVPRGAIATFVRAPGTSVRVSRLSPAKTTVGVVLSAAVLAIAVLLIALSQADLGD